MGFESLLSLARADNRSFILIWLSQMSIVTISGSKCSFRSLKQTTNNTKILLKYYQRMTILTSTVSILTMPGRKSFRAEVTLGAEVEKSSLKQKCHSGFECFMRSFKVTKVKHCWHALSRSGWKKVYASSSDLLPKCSKFLIEPLCNVAG